MAHGALHQGLGGDAAVFCPQLLFQGPAVDADADGDALLAADVRHGLDLLFPADIAGVDAQGVDPPLRTRQGEFVVEMDVGDQGNADLLLDFVHGLCRRLVRDGHPDDLASGGLQLLDLGHGSGHIVGLGIAHGLDGHRGAAAHSHPAHHQLLCHIRVLPIGSASKHPAGSPAA